MNINLTDNEREYITHAIILLKESLDDICDENRQLKVDFMTQEEVDEEYNLIDSILQKVAGNNEK